MIIRIIPSCVTFPRSTPIYIHYLATLMYSCSTCIIVRGNSTRCIVESYTVSWQFQKLPPIISFTRWNDVDVGYWIFFTLRKIKSIKIYTYKYISPSWSTFNYRYIKGQYIWKLSDKKCTDKQRGKKYAHIYPFQLEKGEKEGENRNKLTFLSISIREKCVPFFFSSFLFHF